MKFKRSILTSLFLSFSVSSVLASNYSYEDILLLRNDKEVKSVYFDFEDMKKIRTSYADTDFNDELRDIFYSSVYQFVETSKLRCELNLPSIFISNLESQKIGNGPKDIKLFAKILRANHHIDDFMYEFLVETSKDFYALKEIDAKKYMITDKEIKKFFRPRDAASKAELRNYNKIRSVNDPSSLYSNFKSWPAEKDFCAYQEYNFIKSELVDPKKPKANRLSSKKKRELLHYLNLAALFEKRIDTKTFKKLDYLNNKSFLNRRYLRLEDYLNVVFKAKNKMKTSDVVDVIDIEKENSFTTEKLGRFTSITRRKDLYEKYNETQIIMLAQVLRDASIRMGVDPDFETGVPYITQEFSFIDPNGERKNLVEKYEFTPLDQYNFARRRMRKDILDLEAMDIFNGQPIYYDEVITAAFETGYLTFEDIEYALRYDNLWNPTQTKFEVVSGYVFSFLGYASFFVPPPHNVTTSLVLAIAQNIVNSKIIKGEENDNPASIIN